jgi:hypothetical protein
MSTSNIKMSVQATGPGLDLTIRVNGAAIYQEQPATDVVVVSHDFPDVEGNEYRLEIELSGKNETHTVVDEEGNITSDVRVIVNGFELDGVNIDQLVFEKSRYSHDFNGSQPATVDQFFGDMGCNGTVEFSWTTPVFVWLLENN